jgi:RNA polymerase II elongation factor ELL
MERNKEQRSSLVHELASQDQTQSYLQDRWDGAEEDFKYHLEKVGEHSQDSKKWTLKTMYWKELNVWEYDYDTQEDRQMAIDNAIRKYDKQRVDPSDSLWEKLLPKDERGKGKCLSRLQAKLDKGPPPTASNAPKIKIQKADDSSTSREDGDASDARSGGESMSRTKSNPLPTKATKPSAQDAQYKRMLNPKARAAPQKPSPTKAKDTSSKPNGKRILSQAIIENSDSSGDEAVIVNTQPPPKPASKPPVKAPATKPRPAVKEPAKSQPIKRPRQEEPDDSSSSSEAPLAQRLPQKQARQIKPVKQQQRHMESNSQAARGSSTSSSQPQRHKNTSPVKSSPLASSPPTNASDFETNAPRSKKRKAEDDVPARSAKRSASRSVPTEVMTRAQRFKMYYQKYEALHNEVSSLSNPPDDKVADLVDMRNRLEGMKREIYRRFQAVSA